MSRSKRANKNQPSANVVQETQASPYLNDAFVARAAELGIPFTEMLDDESSSPPVDDANKGKSPWRVIAGQALIALAIVIAGGLLLYGLVISPLEEYVASLPTPVPTTAATASIDNAGDGAGDSTGNNSTDTTESTTEQSSEPVLGALQISPSQDHLGEVFADGRTLEFFVAAIDTEGRNYAKPITITMTVMEGGATMSSIPVNTAGSISRFEYNVATQAGIVGLDFIGEYGISNSIEFEVQETPLHSIALDLSSDEEFVADGETRRSMQIAFFQNENGDLWNGEATVNVTVEPEGVIGIDGLSDTPYKIENGMLADLTISPVTGINKSTLFTFTVSVNDLATDTAILTVVPPPVDLIGQRGDLCKIITETTLSVANSWNFGSIPAEYSVGCNSAFPNEVAGYVLVTIPIWVRQDVIINDEISADSNVMLFGLEDAGGERTITRSNVEKGEKGNIGYWVEGRSNDAGTHTLVFLTGYVLKADRADVE